jgi:hypothetical protein
MCLPGFSQSEIWNQLTPQFQLQMLQRQAERGREEAKRALVCGIVSVVLLTHAHLQNLSAQVQHLQSELVKRDSLIASLEDQLSSAKSRIKEQNDAQRAMELITLSQPVAPFADPMSDVVRTMASTWRNIRLPMPNSSFTSTPAQTRG